MAIKPLGERVLLKPVASEEKTASGLYIPGNAQEKPQEAEVVAVGGKVEEINAGDTVIYGKYAGAEITRDGVDYIIMKEEEILAVV